MDRTQVTLGLIAAVGVAAGVAGPDIAIGAATTPQFESLSPAKAQDLCTQLTGKTMEGAVIDRAEFIQQGTPLTPPPPVDERIQELLGAPKGKKASVNFCRVSAHIAPVAGSHIKMQIVLPQKWNRKFLGSGGGGLNGGLFTAPWRLNESAVQGYAGVATDAGHDVAMTAEWARGNPEKMIDYGHRANHLGARVAKAVITAYYGSKPERAYFSGCSNGGRDALMLAQRYPGDYDAIIAGAPANNFTALFTRFARYEQIVRLSPGKDVLGPKLKLVHDAAIRQCDALDGLKDGLIERPAACHADPAALQCKPGQTSNCLTKREVGAVKAIYADVRTSDGKLVIQGLPVGSEYEWLQVATSENALGSVFGKEFFSAMVYNDRDWSMANFNLDKDYPAAVKRLGAVLDATDPDLRPFLAKGGKLLMYHGWDDAAIPAGNSIAYYKEMTRRSGPAAAAQTRLFMLPGVAHCAFGHGPDSVDYLAELDRWAETGIAPERMIASKYETPSFFAPDPTEKPKLTRPVCAWPKVVKYNGSGPVDSAASYSCRASKTP
jgi:pimeloyl-ACP methyl ester carboxylesterase